MPYATADRANLYYEETGSGEPIVFVHEFAADLRAWESQVRHLSRGYRCIAFNARGYTPSDVPLTADAYGCEHSAKDIGAVLDHLKIANAHVVGLSMGAYAAMLFGIRQPQRVRSLVLAGVGSGSEPGQTAEFRHSSRRMADQLELDGFTKIADEFAMGPNRRQLAAKDPRGWRETVEQLREHSAKGSAMTMRHYQSERPTVYEYDADLRKLNAATLVIVGDEDEPCLNVSVYLKRTLPNADLMVIPGTGHSVNLEEPTAFNQALAAFIGCVQRGQ